MYKEDTNINAVNTDLATACNSSTAPVNNCASTEYSCNSAIFKPAFVDETGKLSIAIVISKVDMVLWCIFYKQRYIYAKFIKSF